MKILVTTGVGVAALTGVDGAAFIGTYSAFTEPHFFVGATSRGDREEVESVAPEEAPKAPSTGERFFAAVRKTGDAISGIFSGADEKLSAQALRLAGVVSDEQRVPVSLTYKVLKSGDCSESTQAFEFKLRPTKEAVKAVAAVAASPEPAPAIPTGPWDASSTLARMQDFVSDLGAPVILHDGQAVALGGFKYSNRVEALGVEAAACKLGWLDDAFAEPFETCRAAQERAVPTEEAEGAKPKKTATHDSETPLVERVLRAPPGADHPLYALDKCGHDRAESIDIATMGRFRETTPVIVKDVARMGNLEEVMLGAATEAALFARGVAVRDGCARVVGAYIFKTVPWVAYIQGVSMWCRQLLGLVGLSEEQTWRAMVHIGDQINLFSRYSNHRLEDGLKVFAHYLLGAVRAHLPELAAELDLCAAQQMVSDQRTETMVARMWYGYVLIMGIPMQEWLSADGKRGLLEFIMTTGRGGFVALFLAHMQVQAEIIAAAADGDADMADMLRQRFSGPPMRCDPDECERNVRKAMEIATAMLNKDYGQAPAGPKLNLGGLKKKAATAAPVHEPLLFSDIVKMLDILAADGMEQTRYDWVLPGDQADLPVRAAKLATRLGGFGGAPFTFPGSLRVPAYEYKIVDELHCLMGASFRSVDLAPTSSAVRMALAILAGGVAPREPASGQGAAGLGLSVIVGGAERRLPPASFDPDTGTLAEELAACKLAETVSSFIDSSTQCPVLMSPRDVNAELEGLGHRPLTPLIHCLAAMRDMGHRAGQAHLYAALEARHQVHDARIENLWTAEYAPDGSEDAQKAVRKEQVEAKCEEIITVYAIRLANDAFAVLPAMPAWCAFLVGTLGLSSEDSLHTIVRMGNEITGQTRHGHRRAAEYGMTMASYWVAVIKAFWPGVVGEHLAAAERLFGPQHVATGLGLAIESGLLPENGGRVRDIQRKPVWDFLLQHGRPGMTALLVAAMDFRIQMLVMQYTKTSGANPNAYGTRGKAAFQQLFTNLFGDNAGTVTLNEDGERVETLSFADMLDAVLTSAARILEQTWTTADGAKTLTFRQLTAVVDALVDAAMMRNQYLIGARPGHA